MTPKAVIFDLDGVIRDWNDDDMTEVELAFGIEPGTILAVGFGPELGPAATTGAMTYREWMDAIRALIIDGFDTVILARGFAVLVVALVAMLAVSIRVINRYD